MSNSDFDQEETNLPNDNDNANPDEYSGEILGKEQCYESEPDCHATGTGDSGNCYPSEGDLKKEQVHGDYDQNIDNRSNAQSDKGNGESFQKIVKGVVQISQDGVEIVKNINSIKETFKGNQGVSQPSQGSPRSDQCLSQSSQGVSQPSQGSPQSNQGTFSNQGAFFNQGSPQFSQGVSQSSQGKPWVIYFRWEHEGKLINKRISQEEAARDNLNGPIIRIGRDKSSCNLHLENESVSRQQAEVYFNEQQQKFFIRSLQPKNINQVDGKKLIEAQELPLKQGSIIVLGEQKVEVTKIEVYEIEPTNYVVPSGANSLQQWMLMFQWNYNGQLINKRISQEEAARDNLNDPIIRIGREKLSCNLHLEDSSVSRQQAEIYFDEQQQTFFIKNLHFKNITQVDGQSLGFGEELPLKQGSIIVLGQQKVEVTKIEVYEIEPTNYSAIVPYNSNSRLHNSNSSLAESAPNPKESKSQPKPSWNIKDLRVIELPILFYRSSITVCSTLISACSTVIEFLIKHPWLLGVGTVTTIAGTGFYLNNQDYKDIFKKHLEKVSDKKEKKGLYYQLALKNNCQSDVKYAISFVAIDNVRETKGLYTLKANTLEPRALDALTPQRAIYVYAITKISRRNGGGDVNVEFKQEGSQTFKKDISTTQPGFIYIDVPSTDPNRLPIGMESKTFYQIPLDENPGKITYKAFNCNDDILTLTLVNDP